MAGWQDGWLAGWLDGWFVGWPVGGIAGWLDVGWISTRPWCGAYTGFQLAGDNLAQLAITADGENKLEAALEDTSYALRASVTDPDPSKGLLVKNCQAFDGLGGSIQLVDDRFSHLLLSL